MGFQANVDIKVTGRGHRQHILSACDPSLQLYPALIYETELLFLLSFMKWEAWYFWHSFANLTLILCISDFSWSTVFIIWLLLLQIWSCVLNPGLCLLDPNLSPNTIPILIFTSLFSLLLFLILCYIYWLTAFYDLPMSAHEGQHNRED